jgi:hypothetical protein
MVQNARAVSMPKVYRPRVPPLALDLVFVAWLSLAESKIFGRLLFSDSASSAFVVESVRGVLGGTPVSKSWQHRLLAPFLVSAMGGVSLEAVVRFFGVTLLLANVLVFTLLWRSTGSRLRGHLGVVCLGFAHFVLAYKLEYPWDGIDQLLFVAFGVWAARDGDLLPIAPLLLVGTFNHETILYVPLWYLLAADWPRRVAGLVSAVVMGGVIVATRGWLYRGRPGLPNQVFEDALPVLENHLHVMHNVRALFVHNWPAGRLHLTLGFVGATTVLAYLTATGTMRRAAVWSLVVLATIVCFGYVNETRHYLVLAAFWVAYVSSGYGARTRSRPDAP